MRYKSQPLNRDKGVASPSSEIIAKDLFKEPPFGVNRVVRVGIMICVVVLWTFALVIYALVVSRIRLWATSGRNAASATSGEGAIELAPASKWYSRVPEGDADAEAHVIGDDD